MVYRAIKYWYKSKEEPDKKATAEDDSSPTAHLVRDAITQAQKARAMKADNTSFCYHCNARIGVGEKPGPGRELYNRRVGSVALVCDRCFADKTGTKHCLLQRDDMVEWH